MRHDGRAQDELRPLDLLPGFVETADGSVLFSIGKTRVICTASVDADTPRWLRGTGRGWVSAEYGMLQRELGRDVTLVSAAEELAEEVAATLARKRIARDHGRRGSYRFACTGDSEAFASVGRRFLQLPISSVRALGAGELAGLSLAAR